MKKIIIIINIIVCLNCIGQNNKNMDTIYNKNHDELKLMFLRKSTTDKVAWRTVLKTKRGKDLILYQDSIKKGYGWESQEERDESPVDLYNICGSFLDENNLYIIYNRFGSIFMEKYIFKEGDNFIKEKKIINQILVSPGFGKMINNAHFIKIENYIYFIVDVFQSGIRKKSKMFKISRYSINKIKHIKFLKDQNIIKVCTISDFGKDYYKQIQYEMKINAKNSTTELDFYHQVKDKINKIYFLEKKLNSENESLPFGIKNYKLFLDKNRSLINSEIEKANFYIKEVLNFNNNNFNTDIFTKGYIHVNSQEKYIAFFYKTNSSIKIIRHNLYEGEWQISNYKEEEIPEID